MKKSSSPFVSPGTMLFAIETNRTYLPLPLMSFGKLCLLPTRPLWVRLANIVVPVCRSRTYASPDRLVSAATSFECERNNTKCPSGVISGSTPPFVPTEPSVRTLTSVVVPSLRSRTKTSAALLVSSGVSSSLASKATKRPSAVIFPPKLGANSAGSLLQPGRRGGEEFFRSWATRNGCGTRSVTARFGFEGRAGMRWNHDSQLGRGCFRSGYPWSPGVDRRSRYGVAGYKPEHRGPGCPETSGPEYDCLVPLDWRAPR